MAALIGLGVAVEYALQWGIEAIRDRITPLAERLREALATVPGVRVRDRGRTKCGIVTFTVDGRNPGDVQKQLRERRVNVSVLGKRSTPLDERDLDLVVRASVHYYNTDEELDQLVDGVRPLSQA